ncbi:hypothetical protein [Pinirhizobacter sp.]|jgi:hypothetical protein|uniref:hypothetical protein n=1 Tax=Pinirhizobacter sp. TaxID=2950432 RepID=UPI002F3E8BF4
MHAYRIVAVASVAVAALAVLGDMSVHAAEPPSLSRARIFTLVNATSDSMLSVALAPASSGQFADASLGGPLQGGLTSTAIHIAAGPCLRDVAIDFQGGRHATLSHVDVCQGTGLRVTSSVNADSTINYSAKPDERQVSR